MKFIVFFLLLILVACSGDVENKKAPEKESMPVESKPVNPLKPQSDKAEEHISGSGQARISGGPSSAHISGQ